MRGPLGRLSSRFGKRRLPSEPAPAVAKAPPLPGDMDRGAAEMQRRLEQARVRLKDAIPPQPDDR